MDRESEIRKIVESFGASLYDIELIKSGDGAHIFRVSIQKEGGVDLDICADINAVLSPYLDTNPPVKGRYYLEVSSPGIERALKKAEHFIKSQGELVKVTLKNSKKIKGKLIYADSDKIRIESPDGEITEVLISEISKAKTYFEWK